MTTERDTSPQSTPSSTPRRYGTGALVAVALASAALAAGAAMLFARPAQNGSAPTAATAAAPQPAKEMWQCPMHPSIVQDHPGDCPICGMKLVKVEPSKAGAGGPAGAAASAHAGDRRIKFYRSPMDPKQTSPTPRKDEMGMDYVPVYEDEAAGAPSGVPGQATVEIDPARQQLIGLQTAQAVEGDVSGAWRTVGRVSVDETRVRHVNVKVPGYVERIFVDFVGKPVRKGEPLFTVYSPELFAAQQEYLLALKTRDALSSGGALKGDGDALVKAARRRLELWDIPDSEIQRIVRTGEPSKTLTLYSPVAGVVTKKDVVEGMKLDAGAMPYEIVDLSSVWVLADVYESELRHVKEGMPATMTLKAFPGQEFKGRVLFIDPMLDPTTRTVKVRLAFANPGRTLKPEMFGDVVLRGSPRRGLLIPQDAVVNSGTQSIVFVSLGGGKFQPRAVQLGDASGPSVEVVEGLAAGEQVVTRANFLIDSESRLRASLAELANAPSGSQPESARVLPGAGQGAAEPQRQGDAHGGTGATDMQHHEMSGAHGGSGTDAAHGAHQP